MCAQYMNKMHEPASCAILWIGYEQSGNNAYPHTDYIVKHFISLGGDYTIFRERGYFESDLLIPGFSPYLWYGLFKRLAKICIDTGNLIKHRIMKKYDLVVAMDNFSFVVAGLFFKNVILWSLDFITDDNSASGNWVNRTLRNQVSASLYKNPRIIIQDDQRLRLFCDLYRGPVRECIDAFLLPVSLPPPERNCCIWELTRSKPVLMQIGGINSWRSSSDRLIADYQKNHRYYDLAFHGFVEQGLLPLLRDSEYMPWVSTVTVKSSELHKIIEKCDIGVIIYNRADANFFYIANSSGQLVEFLRCGKPIITLNNTGLGGLVKEKEIGVSIEKVEDLIIAVKKITSNYKLYSRNCSNLYEERYNLDKKMVSFEGWLNCLKASVD